MSNKSAKEMTTQYTEVDVSRLEFTDLEENQRSKGQKIAYPRYDDPQHGSNSPLFIQMPWVHLNSYGIPRISEYYPDDSKRGFVKIPLDQSIPEIKQFTELIKKIDDKLGSDEYKNKLFGSKASKYEYQPIFRQPMEEDEDSKPKDKKDYGPKQPYMKLKIDTTYPDNKVKTIVFNSIMENGKRVRTKLDSITTIDDIASHICFMCKMRPIIRPVKLWAHAPNKKDPGYGLSFKMAKVEVEPPSKTTSNVKKYLESDAFLDSDEESDTIATVAKETKDTKETKETKTETKAKPEAKKQVAEVESDEESEDEKKAESEDESEEEVVKPVAKGKTKVAVVASESDEESDEEVKPAKGKAKSVTKTVSKPSKR